jgi:hypothetical protein
MERLWSFFKVALKTEANESDILNETTEQKQPQYPIERRSDIPTQDTTYTTYIIISPQLSATPQKETSEHTELSIICTRVIAHGTYTQGTKISADSQDEKLPSIL